MTLLEEFRAYIAAMPLVEEERPLYEPDDQFCTEEDKKLTYTSRLNRLEQYWYNPELGFDDFNKEMTPPSPSDPDGTFGIRSDDDFWIEAILPYRFHTLTIEEIVSVIWPDIEQPVFGPDVWNEAS